MIPIAMSLDPAKNPKCESCGRVDTDQVFRKVFRRSVCKKCQEEKPEKYSLLTKTECKEVSIHSCCLVWKSDPIRQDYLLTDREETYLFSHAIKLIDAHFSL